MKKIVDLLRKTIYVLTPSQRKLCVLVFIMTCIGSLLECLGVSVIIPLVSVIQNPEALLASSYMQRFTWLRTLDYSMLIILIVCGVVFIYIFKNVYFVFQSWVRAKFSFKIQREMSVKMLTSILSRGYQYFLDMNYGEYVRAVSGDANAIYGVISAAFKLVSETFTILLISLFMFIADWQLALAVVSLALICLFLIYFIFRKRMYQAGLTAREYASRTGQAQNQAYYGVKDVLLFGKQKYFIYEYEKNCIEAQKAQCTQTVGSESPSYIIEGICISGIMIAVGLKIVVGGADSGFIAILAAFAVGAFRVLPSLGKISTSINALTVCIPQISALYDSVRAAESYAKEHPEATAFLDDTREDKGLISSGNTYNFEKHKTVFSTGKFKETLLLDNISFSYAENLGNVLDKVTLPISKGQAIALIGESGAGKSTLVDVLLGLLIPQEGHILMDGVDTKTIPDKWAETIGYVPQSVFLCDDSIKKNVAFGERDEDIDEELVRDALAKAEMLEFVDSLPDGLDNKVGDRGVRLSGGQRQRIAIARALYHRPEILVLDEATSALDNETESAIMDAIDSLYGQVTLIIVAHRLTTVQNCDIIYEVGGGNIKVVDKAELFAMPGEQK